MVVVICIRVVVVEHGCFFMWYLCQPVLQNFGCVGIQGSQVSVVLWIVSWKRLFRADVFFSVGRGWYSSICCASFRGVFDASVVAVEDQLCVRGFGLSSFCEVILVSSRFCLCIDDVVWSWGFCAKTVSQMVSPRTIGCVILTPLSGSEALCSRIGVFLDGWMCCFLWGLHRVLVCCDWVHATHELYSDFVVHCCMQGSRQFCKHVHLRQCWKFHFIMLFQRSWIASWAHHVDVCVFYFRVRASCSRHRVCPCVNICWRREDFVWTVLLCQISRTHGVHVFFWCGW